MQHGLNCRKGAVKSVHHRSRAKDAPAPRAAGGGIDVTITVF
ncbi:hypothetical protein FHS82_003425 [Pseudochelatococcus lubricantis]|uniref:Uncharacterized protein n=1 Tax=Pseudochelatococcus lubricantis TaxID=1538102 RepID=A0ABX0V2Y0_9HYPH|nr:hypothetical protein [Pseudochelatococcus lubricantis]NIJ59567.1 hypothetical protein [Pseudochelatococcus lubricantis]